MIKPKTQPNLLEKYFSPSEIIFIVGAAFLVTLLHGIYLAIQFSSHGSFWNSFNIVTLGSPLLLLLSAGIVYRFLPHVPPRRDRLAGAALLVAAAVPLIGVADTIMNNFMASILWPYSGWQRMYGEWLGVAMSISPAIVAVVIVCVIGYCLHRQKRLFSVSSSYMKHVAMVIVTGVVGIVATMAYHMAQQAPYNANFSSYFGQILMTIGVPFLLALGTYLVDRQDGLLIRIIAVYIAIVLVMTIIIAAGMIEQIVSGAYSSGSGAFIAAIVSIVGVIVWWIKKKRQR